MNRKQLRNEFEEAEREHDAHEAEFEEMQKRIDRAMSKQLVRKHKLTALRGELEEKRRAYQETL